MQQVLGRFGNMSSATVLFVLRHFLDSNRFRQDDLILARHWAPDFVPRLSWAGVKTEDGKAEDM